MAAPKRTPAQIAVDRLKFEDLYLHRGYSLAQIQEWVKLNRPYSLSRPTIGRDCQKVLEELRQRMGLDKKDALVIQLRKLDKQEAALWELFDESKQPTRTTSEVMEGTRPKSKPKKEGQKDPKETLAVAPDKITRSTKEQTNIGQVQIIAQITRITELRCKLMGLITSNSYYQQNNNYQGSAPKPVKEVYDLGNGVVLEWN